MASKERKCKQYDCPSWGECPFKRDVNACRSSTSLEGDLDVELID